jgi:2-iminobutanoate/2-iminopropanoate deaminase
MDVPDVICIVDASFINFIEDYKLIDAIVTSNAPEAVGPYSQAIKVGNLLFISGQLPIDAATGQFNSQDVVEQADQCLKNVSAIATAAGSSLSNAVKLTVLLASLDRFAEVNEVYSRYFTKPFPARACYAVSALPKGAQIEIEAVVAL